MEFDINYIKRWCLIENIPDIKCRGNCLVCIVNEGKRHRSPSSIQAARIVRNTIRKTVRDD